MLRWIIGTSLRIRYLVIIIATVLMVFGLTQLQSMPVDIYPEFDPPIVEVQTEALGLPAEEVESLITVPMEADLLNGVAWMSQIYSESVAGLSSILLVFEPGTDPIKARQMVQERLTQAFALPNVSKPPVMLQPLSTTNRVMIVGLSSKELSLIDMGVLARWTITPRLMGVAGVANVAIWGQRDWQLQVQIDPERLQAEGVALHQVIETAGEALWVSPLSFLEASSPGTAGWIDTPNQRLSIRHLLPISSAEDLSKVAIVDGDGLLLGDIADVVEDHQPLIGDAALSNGPGLLLVIEKFPNANMMEVTRGVEEAFEIMRPGLKGIDIDTSVFRPASYIEMAGANLANIGLFAAVLMALMLGAFLFEWRSAVIGMLAILVSLVSALFVLYLRGVSMNLMVLAGMVMALAIIVDDAMVDLNKITDRLRQERQRDGGHLTAAVILTASLSVRGPLIFATLIVLLSVVPVFFISGLSGAFLQPLVITYIMAVLTSMLVALLITPALSLIFFGDTLKGRRESPVVLLLQKTYEKSLTGLVGAPGRAFAIAVVFILIGIATLPFLQIELLPELNQTDLLLHWEGAPGTSRTQMNRILSQVASELGSIPGVRNVSSHVGRAVTGDQVVGINSGELWISLDPAEDIGATRAAIAEVVSGYPGQLQEAKTYQPRRIGEVLSGSKSELVVRIYGHDLDVLREKSIEVSQAITGIPGIHDIKTDLPAEEPQVEIEVNLASAEKYHVKPGDVRRSATTLLSGLQVGNLYEEQKVFDVVVLGIPELRNSMTNIRELLIDTPEGGHVRLADVAEVRIVPTPIIIKRDAVSRFVDVTLSIEGRLLSSVAIDIEQRLAGINFPLEHHAEVMGQHIEQQVALQRTMGFVVAAIFGIFLLLQASYGSWRLAFAAVSTLPMALVGCAIAALLSGGVLSLGSLFGFITVLGLAVRNGILMARHYQDLERDGEELFGKALVLRGARERIAPILMTTIITAAALLPMLFAGNIAGLEFVRPMAVVILGGLITSTLLVLFVLPALYLRYGANREVEIELILSHAGSNM